MGREQEEQVFNLKKVTNNGKINFTELIAEARVQRIIEEEEQLEQENSEVSQIKAQTLQYIELMIEARDQGDEEKRREYRNEIVVLNLRLVTQVLKKYGYFSPDKFQNGCVGLLKAADTFDLEKGVPFHNYAAFCIETEIRMAFRKTNRMFESKVKGYLDSLDAESQLDEGDARTNHERASDPLSEEEFDSILVEADVDVLFYDIIVPCIEEYGQRSLEVDMEKWRALELQYFLELAAVDSQRQRLTFTEMARQLGTVPQNLRVRHKKVMALIRQACEDYGYHVGVAGGVYYDDNNGRVTRVSRRRAGSKWR